MSGLEEYRRKVEYGEVSREKSRNPAERFADNRKSRTKAIHAKCWDCCAFQREEIRKCTMTDCPLHAFRPYK